MPSFKDCPRFQIQSNPACHGWWLPPHPYHTCAHTYITQYTYITLSLYMRHAPRFFLWFYFGGPGPVGPHGLFLQTQLHFPFSQFLLLYISRRLPPFSLYKQLSSFFSTLQLLILYQLLEESRFCAMGEVINHLQPFDFPLNSIYFLINPFNFLRLFRIIGGFAQLFVSFSERGREEGSGGGRWWEEGGGRRRKERGGTDHRRVEAWLALRRLREKGQKGRQPFRRYWYFFFFLCVI